MISLPLHTFSLQSLLPLDSSITQRREVPRPAYIWPTSSPGEARNCAYVLREIDNMLLPVKELRSGWHGPKSVAISGQVIARLRQLAAVAASAGLPVPEVTPNPHGTITLEWESENASFSLEVGISKLSGYLRTEGNDPILVSDGDQLSFDVFAAVQSTLVPSDIVRRSW